MEPKVPNIFKSVQPFMQILNPVGERIIFVDSTFKTDDEKLAKWLDEEVVTDKNMGIYREGKEPGYEKQVHNDPEIIKAQLDAWRKTHAEATGQVSATTPDAAAAANLGAASSQSSAAMGRTSGGSSFQETPQQANAAMMALRQKMAETQANKDKDTKDVKQPEAGKSDSGASAGKADESAKP